MRVIRFARTSLLVTLVFLVVSQFSAPVAASKSYEACVDICTLDIACNTDCTILGDVTADTTCGEWTGGQCGNTCDSVCNYGVDGSTGCEGNGGDPMTCQNYGVYLSCGDSVCAPESGENSDTCSNDCPLPVSPFSQTTTLVQADVDALLEAADLIESQGGFEETLGAVQILLAYGHAYGYTPYVDIDFDPEDYSEPAPDADQAYEGDSSSFATARYFNKITCQQKAARLDTLWIGVGALTVSAGAYAGTALLAGGATPPGIALGAAAAVHTVAAGAVTVWAGLYGLFKSCTPNPQAPEPQSEGDSVIVFPSVRRGHLTVRA